ncbi:MAG: sulfotransferase family 2 domain-containing protein [Pseudomonadales bacterium]
MIVSHSNRFIFFAVPKTGTHAVRELLHPFMGEDDWEQQALFEQKRLPIPELARIEHGHLSVRDIKPFLSADQWSEYYKFGFVRNPFDRFVSICFFLNRKNPDFHNHSLAWMKSALRRPQFCRRVLVRPQYLQLIDESGELALDNIGRYEQFQESVDAICSSLSLPQKQLPVKNTSEHNAFDLYYDEELYDLVKAYYSKDLEMFDYA